MANSKLDTRMGIGNLFMVALNETFNGIKCLRHVFYDIEYCVEERDYLVRVEFRQGEVKESMAFDLKDPVTMEDIRGMANHTYAWALLLYQDGPVMAQGFKPYTGDK